MRFVDRVPGEADAGGAARGCRASSAARSGWLGYDVVRSFERLPEHEARRPGPARALLRAHRHGRGLRQPARHAQGRRLGRRRRRHDPGRAYDDACARIEAVLDRLARPAPPLPPLESGAGRRRHPRRTRPSRAKRYEAGVRRIQEYILAGDAFQVVLRSASRSRAARRSVRRLPRAAGDQPVAVHVPPRVPRGGGHRRLARGAGAAGRRRGRGAPDRRHAPARRHRRGGRRAGGRAARRPEGAGRARDADRPRPQRRRPRVGARHRPARRSGWWSSATRTSCTWSSNVQRHAGAPGIRPADVVRAAFPAGTLSGAPKIRAMEIIEELEPARRGIYGGAVGYLSYTGNMDLAIAIRTLVTKRRHHLRAGRRGHRRRQRPAGRSTRSASTRRAPWSSAVEMARAPAGAGGSD